MKRNLGQELIDGLEEAIEYEGGKDTGAILSIPLINDYGNLARRTLSSDVAADPLKVTMNAATGLSSETGEIIELISSAVGPDEYSAFLKHMEKELGDWMWYWSLMCHAYGFYESEIMLTKNINHAANGIKELGTWPVSRAIFALPIVTGSINEFVKKHWFHNHPLDVAVIRRHLHTALYTWFQTCAIYKLQPSRVLGTNIEKLRKRYPEGFSVEKSLNRAPGDI